MKKFSELMTPDKIALFKNGLGSPDKKGCIIWKKSKNLNGYGQMGFKDRPRLAHRIAWFLANGEPTRGLCVCHRCDNPPCCNPKHLFLGTHKQNAEDMCNKGRGGRGSTHYRAGLTEDDVRRMRKMSLAGTKLECIAEQYDLSRQNAWQIVVGKRWKHLPIYQKGLRG